ncbi:MAG: hypothetical protein JOS17DRAFT_738606 [Linnemannia elongata]|nr:MAG: hypothetical protein JOS17DRAFT_738606 [Linnemannia elongata]
MSFSYSCTVTPLPSNNTPLFYFIFVVVGDAVVVVTNMSRVAHLLHQLNAHGMQRTFHFSCLKEKKEGHQLWVLHQWVCTGSLMMGNLPFSALSFFPLVLVFLSSFILFPSPRWT